MRSFHFFEFMDLKWLPSGLRMTLREILECGNSQPFRPYYRWVANDVLCLAQEAQLKTIVELGAGTAPITRHLAGDSKSDGLLLIACDNNPDHESYMKLEQRFPGKVCGIREPVDFSQLRRWGKGSLLVLSATFHHVPASARRRVISALSESADRVVIFEPLRKTFLSVLFVFLSTFPAIIVPILYFFRTGRFRRIFWCWILPIAPLMFLWDGVVSCLRQWTDQEWRFNLNHLDERGEQALVRHSLFSQKIEW